MIAQQVTLARIGEVVVRVSPARIEEAAESGQFDALVSSDDSKLSMSGGVSKALLHAAGASIRDEVQKSFPLKVGDVVVTTAGRLAASYILHAITLDHERGIKPTEQSIRYLSETLFRRCESLQIRHLALPAIATGAAGFAPADSARLLLATLAEHAGHPTALRTVVFCLPNDAARQAFTLLVQAGISGDPSDMRSTGADRPFVKSSDLAEAQPLSAPTVTSARSSEADAREQMEVLRVDSVAPTLGVEDPFSKSGQLAHGRESEAVRAQPVPGMSATVKSGGGLLTRVRGWFRSEPAVLDLGPAAGRLNEAHVFGREPRQAATASSRTRPAQPGAQGERTWLPGTDVRAVLGRRYVLLEELGRGGMGVVYLAWDLVLRQLLAVKTLRPDGAVARDHADMLRREAAVQIGLVHESIVRLLHFEPGDRGTPPYILMEYVPWASGERWLAEAGIDGLPEHAVLCVGSKLCEGLACAHAANVLHGDIKPSNVFVDPAAENAKLADFGIARVAGTHEQHALVTRLVGTPAFMAPEQKTRGARLGPWTDVYLLGRTLAVFLDPLNALRDRGAASVGTMSDRGLLAIKSALAERPEDRPRTATEFGRLLSEAAGAAA